MGNSEIYVKNANGSNPVNISNNPDEDKMPSWGTLTCNPTRKHPGQFVATDTATQNQVVSEQCGPLI